MDNPIVWASDGEEAVAFLADATSEEVAEAIGGVVYVFDQEEREE